MINLSALANNISDAVRGIGAELGIIPRNSGRLYPGGFDNIQSHTSDDWSDWSHLSFPYTFAVMNLKTGKSDVFEDFSLPIAPSNITQSEDFAISIKPTQGGSVTTHSGNKFKTLSISGTTGINPFRGMAGVDALTGVAIAKPNELKYKSGYEVFIELRNWFKTYYQWKKDWGSLSAVQDVRLVFKNFKDGEILIVELLKFTMKRSAERSLLYDYEMEFKVLSHFTFEPVSLSPFQNAEKLLNLAVSKIDTARGIFLRTQEVLRNIESTYNATIIEPLRKISLAVKAFVGIELTAADVGNRIYKNTLTAISALDILKTIKQQKDAAKTGSITSVPPSIVNASLPVDLVAATQAHGADTIIELNEVLLDIPASSLPQAVTNALNEEIVTNSDNPKSFYEETREQLKRIQQNTEDAFNLGSATYDALFDRTATLEADTGKQITNDEFDILQAFNEAVTGINQILSTNVMFKTNFKSKINSIESSFVDSLNLRALPSVKQVVMPADIDLEQIAFDELGDPIRWVEIAELNNLQSPYVSQDRTDTRSYVIKPGDTLLIPQSNIFGESQVPDAKQIPSTAGLSYVEKSLGTDLMLDNKQDLVLANNGDLAVISGTNNMAQAIVLKIQYEKGELRNHPTLGVGVQVGSKFLTLETIRDNLIKTLSQDPRIKSVVDVQLLREGSSLYMQFRVNIKNIDVPVPLTVKL